MRNSVTKHAGAASVGATQYKNSGRKLGSKRLRADLVGEGPIDRNRTEFAKANAFAAPSKGPNIPGQAFKPISTGLSDAAQAAAYNNSGGRE